MAFRRADDSTSDEIGRSYKTNHSNLMNLTIIGGLYRNIEDIKDGLRGIDRNLKVNLGESSEKYVKLKKENDEILKLLDEYKSKFPNAFKKE